MLAFRMPEILSREEVERIAALASLELTEAEVKTFARQLGEILEYARRVQQIDTSGIAPTSHGVSTAPLDRADDPQPSLDRASVLPGAPDPAQDAGLFRVPRVIG
jgi:aspartyl-tRNA(Asn)/glutamyl-tRNA(Gln) amidotransferase subunit C